MTKRPKTHRRFENHCKRFTTVFTSLQFNACRNHHENLSLERSQWLEAERFELRFMNCAYPQIMRWLISSFLVLVLSACTPVMDDGYPFLNSGLEGLVTVGPQCPVVRVGESCPDLPFAATLELRQAGKLVVQFNSDAQGYFHVAVRPGLYSFEPQSPGGLALPSAGPRPVTVLNGQFSSVTVVYDSGIR
jgi:hypothetical protein